MLYCSGEKNNSQRTADFLIKGVQLNDVVISGTYIICKSFNADAPKIRFLNKTLHWLETWKIQVNCPKKFIVQTLTALYYTQCAVVC